MRQTSAVIFVNSVAFPQDYKCAVSMGMEEGLAGFNTGENCVSSVYVTFTMVSSLFSLSVCSHSIIVVMI